MFGKRGKYELNRTRAIFNIFKVKGLGNNGFMFFK